MISYISTSIAEDSYYVCILNIKEDCEVPKIYCGRYSTKKGLL